jgi:DNA-binding response OmpR family regulator
MKNKTILIIEDETDIVHLLKHYLGKEGYTLYEAGDGLRGLHMAKEKRPHLIVLDLMLPGMDGLEVCRNLRAHPETAYLPILMLTAKGEETDKVIGLELGADDYVAKPFSPKEVVARVKALLRRSERLDKEPVSYRYGSISLDVTRHEVKMGRQAVRLTAREFGLLEKLLKNKGHVLTRATLLDTVWGIDSEVTTRTVDVHVRRLREKIPSLQEAIETVKSYGYKLREEQG